MRACTASASSRRASHSAAAALRVSRQPRIGVSGVPARVDARRGCARSTRSRRARAPSQDAADGRDDVVRIRRSSYCSCRSSPSGSPRSSKRCARTEEEPTSSASTVATRRIYPGAAMAVVIASNLRKELAGTVLFDGVSFSVERRDRVALSGPNGAGKTTLLRILAGETEKHGGELAFAEGDARRAARPAAAARAGADAARVRPLRRARPRRARGGAARGSSRRWPAATHDQATLNRYAEAQARLEHAGGYGWRDHAASVAARARLRGGGPRPPAAHVLRRRADARLARARARRRPRPAAPRRADEPPRRREPRVARARARLARRGRDPRRARPLVPRGGDDGDARARGRPRDVLPRPVARVAAREGGADAARAEGGRARPGRHRAARALRRAVPLPRRTRRSRRRRS